jgi:D-alanyl-D-alanine carboxypeptidase
MTLFNKIFVKQIMIGTLAILPLSSAIGAPTALLCSAKYAQPKLMPDGRLLNHFPYAQANATDLVTVPNGFSTGSCAQVHRAIMPHLATMITAAKKDGIALKGISCFRNIAYQRTTFCRADKLAAQGGIIGRAKSSAPPGYSEHATGYVIDFGNGDADLSASFAGKAMGKWLAANAPRFGFEMSFPKGNAQGVTFEPWHWRWVGTTALVKSKNANALAARALFAPAHDSFPGLGID